MLASEWLAGDNAPIVGRLYQFAWAFDGSRLRLCLVLLNGRQS